MDFPTTTSPVLFSILIGISLLPGVVTWLDGGRLIRRLRRRGGDPALPELRLAWSRRSGAVLGAAIAVVILFGTPIAVPPLLLLAIGAQVVAAFPTRKEILQERWGVGAYLIHVSRLTFAMFGAGLLMVALPYLVWGAAGRSSVVALAVAAAGVLGVLAWSFFGVPIMLFILGATSLENAGLERRFNEVLAKARSPEPRLFRLQARGGRWLNAFAGASVGTPAVLLTDDLLAALGPRETTAIFAHEVAHLEHLSRGRLVRAHLATAVAAALAAALVLWLPRESTALRIFLQGWPLLVYLALARAVSKHRPQETASDMRALELCEDPQALADALTKIHVLNQVPRRWDARFERWATHPSLARRLRAIGRDSSRENRAMTPACFQDADRASRRVVIEGERILWLDAVPAEVPLEAPASIARAAHVESFAYGGLRDLHLEIGGLRHRRLVAVDESGAKHRLALRSEDVGAAKAALDQVDFKVGSGELPQEDQFMTLAPERRSSQAPRSPRQS